MIRTNTGANENRILLTHILCRRSFDWSKFGGYWCWWEGGQGGVGEERGGEGEQMRTETNTIPYTFSFKLKSIIPLVS